MHPAGDHHRPLGEILLGGLGGGGDSEEGDGVARHGLTQHTLFAVGCLGRAGSYLLEAVLEISNNQFLKGVFFSYLVCNFWYVNCSSTCMYILQ